MSLGAKLTAIRSIPLPRRQRLAFFISLILTALIVVVWLININVLFSVPTPTDVLPSNEGNLSWWRGQLERVSTGLRVLREQF